MAMRVPTANVSVVDLVAEVERRTSDADVNAAVKRAAEGPLKGILHYGDEPLVSVDFNGSPYSSIFDATLTRVMDHTLIKVFAWYDNEWGFSQRMRDVTHYIGKSIGT
jgi:glyceraldehyde 3-phosphate dehydrogenase